VARDLDRRGRDDGRRDALALERRKCLGSDAGVALHPGSDHRDLAEVLARAPVCRQRVERAARVGLVFDRRREDDLGPGLDDRVDVHRGVGEGAEETGRLNAVHTVDGLLAHVHDR
jgi:hypothetical protein